MKLKCECTDVHDFQCFKKYRTTFGGMTSHYQSFCKALNKLMIVTTSTYPQNITDALCPSPKKYRKTTVIQDSDGFFEGVLYMLSEKEALK